MRRTLTTLRCVPRFGYNNTEVRTVDLEMLGEHDELEIRRVLTHWFVQRGVADAVYAIDADDNGFFAIINDEAFASTWGDPLL